LGITGNLKTMELAELLQWLSQSRKTGTLVVDNGEVEKRIFFEDGKVISAAASDPKEYLGHFLVSHGFIDEATLAQAMDMQKETKMLLGKILVTIGAISEPNLETMLRLKAEEGIYELFTWQEGDFEFLDDKLPEYTMVPLSIDIPGIVMEGTRRLDEWKAMRERIPSLLCVPVQVAAWAVKEGASGEAKILAMVDDDRTIQEIALQTHSSEFFACRVLYGQLRQRRLKVVRPRTEGSLSGPDRETVNSEALMSTAQGYIESGNFELALRHLKAARSVAPDNQTVRLAVDRAEGVIRERIETAGVVLSAVPRLTAEATDIDGIKISPQEAFILSRLDGVYDLQTILKISPMPQLESQVVFWKLLQAGYIELAGDATDDEPAEPPLV
jgi:hypothetical protein